MGLFSKKASAVAIREDVLLDTSKWAYGNRRAVFLHALMLAMSEFDAWDDQRKLTTSYDRLAKLMVCSESQVRHSIEKLIAANYIRRLRINRNEKGVYTTTVYQVFENNLVKFSKLEIN